jgi:hypothetical protein
MVMDIRNVQGDANGRKKRPVDLLEDPVGDPASLPEPVVEPVVESGPDEDLEELLTLLAHGEGSQQVQAAQKLRVLVPSDEGIKRLCAIVEDTADHRRLPALQALGFHRQWLAKSSHLERVLTWVRVEDDPEAVTAIVWLLRGREVLQELLLHPVMGASREAAIGLPVGASTLDALLDALLVGRGHDIDHILTQRLGTLHPSLTAQAVDHILSVSDRVTGDALSHVLACLPQQPLFELFIEGRSRPAWTAEPSAADTEGLQRWHHVARLASQQLLRAPSGELVRYLVSRSAADDTFARRHAAFMKAAMDNTADVLGADMLNDLERLTVNATDDRLERMARMLMDLSDKIAGGESHSHVSDLLEKWKSRSPELKLKIYHLQQGLK